MDGPYNGLRTIIVRIEGLLILKGGRHRKVNYIGLGVEAGRGPGFPGTGKNFLCTGNFAQKSTGPEKFFGCTGDFAQKWL